MLDSRPVGKWTTLGLASTGCGAATRSARATTYPRYCSNRHQGEMGAKKYYSLYFIIFFFRFCVQPRVGDYKDESLPDNGSKR